jgi:hypothetical protein
MAIHRKLPMVDQDPAALDTRRARWAKSRAAKLLDVRVVQTACAACGRPLTTSRGVLFRGDQLVHAGCWRDDPKPLDDPPPVM